MIATEKQSAARKGRACHLTDGRYGCALANLVQIEGVELWLCKVHEKRIRKIVAENQKHKETLKRAAA